MEKVRICLIGTGRAGMIHARNMKHHVDRAEMIAVSDVVEESAKKAAEELGVHKIYLDYHEALQDPEVDAVVIASPTRYHCEIAVEAARAGKNIFCEKPMAMNVQECDLMIEAAKKYGVKLQIGFMRRFDQAFRKAKQMIDDGVIGEVVSIKSKTRGPSTPKEWMYDIRKSNGPLAEVNSHDIDTVRWLSGSEVKKLYAVAGNYRCLDAKEKWPDFYDTVLMNVSMENGTIGNIDGAQGVKYGYDAGVEVLGTNGCIRVGELRDHKVELYMSNGKTSGDIVDSWRSLYHEAYIEEDKSFVECILKDTEPVVQGKDGKMAVAIVLAGNESIRTGEIVEVKA